MSYVIGLAVGLLVLCVFVLFAIIFVIALIFSLVLLAIQFWYVILPIVAIIILISNRQKIRDWRIERQARQKREEFYRQYHSKPREEHREEPRKKRDTTQTRDYRTQEWYGGFRDSNCHSNYQRYQKRQEERKKSSKNKFYNDIFGGNYNYADKHENNRQYEDTSNNEEFFKSPFGENYSKNDETFDEKDVCEEAFDEVYDRIGDKFCDPKNVNLQNALELLNLSNNSTIKAVKDRFRDLVKQYHPDKCKNKKISEAKFKAIFAAYEIILDQLEVD